MDDFILHVNAKKEKDNSENLIDMFHLKFVVMTSEIILLPKIGFCIKGREVQYSYNP